MTNPLDTGPLESHPIAEGPFGHGPAWLFVPANRPDRWGKAAAAADVVILDLEDAVPPNEKAASREQLAGAVDLVPPERLVVRVNGPTSGLIADDVTAVLRAGIKNVIVPMVEDPADVMQVRGFDETLGVIALCETASGVLACHRVASAGWCNGLMFGCEDLVASLGGSRSRDDRGALLPHVKQMRIDVLIAGAAAGLPVIDTPSTVIADTSAVSAEATEAAVMGFAAKATIHPAQVEAVRSGFRPTSTEVAWAQRVVAQAAHGGASRLSGEMVDGPIVTRARRILHRQGASESATEPAG